VGCWCRSHNPQGGSSCCIVTARLTVHGRRELVRRACEQGLSVAVASRELGVSRQTGSKWVGRYRACGEAGLRDASSRPARLRPRVGERTLRAIVRTRQRQRIGAHQIAWKLGICRSTVCAVLRRLGLNRIRDLEPAVETALRYEHEHPGDLVDLDTKKLGHVALGGGKRFGVHRSSRGVGWSLIFVAVDDATRWAYVEGLADECGLTAAGFAVCALAFHAACGAPVKRILTDNGSCSRSRALKGVLGGGRREALLHATLPAPDQRQGRGVRQAAAERLGVCQALPLEH